MVDQITIMESQITLRRTATSLVTISTSLRSGAIPPPTRKFLAFNWYSGTNMEHLRILNTITSAKQALITLLGRKLLPIK